MGAITRLTAVNEMLLAAGEQLVADLTDGSGISTGIAEHILDQVILDVQLRGIASNIFSRKYKPDATTGKIIIPNNALSAMLITECTNDDGNIQIATIKGTGTNAVLWNITDQTDVWDKNKEYEVELTIKLEWEEIDTPIQRQITAAAKRRYQMAIQGDGDADRMLREEEMFYRTKGKGQDAKRKSRNIYSSFDNMLKRAVNRSGYSTNDPSRFRFWKGTME
jgi:hypothetical protein